MLNNMAFHEWIQLFIKEINQTDWLQWLALGLGVAEVLFAKMNKIWLYPTGIGATLLSIFLLYKAGLFAEGLLNVYYVIMSIYGWVYWIKKKNEPPLIITYTSPKDWVIVSVIVFAGGILLYSVLNKFTPSTVPFWDAWVSSTAWAGMWLLTKRKLENWILLNLSNIFAIPLLFYKQLPLYAALTIFLFVVGCQGYFKWKKILRSDSYFNKQ
jgi:nicotinamide mononucleotide transporter